MRSVCIVAAVAAALVLLPVAAASAQERRSCGNYGHTEGGGDMPVFTTEAIVGAGVEDIRTRVIGCTYLDKERIAAGRRRVLDEEHGRDGGLLLLSGCPGAPP